MILPGSGALSIALWWRIFCRMEPVYISIEAAARLVNRSRSSVKRWLKECRDLIDAGQEPLFAFIDPKDSRRGRVDIHRELFLAFRVSEHRTRRQEKPSLNQWMIVLPATLPSGFDSARGGWPVLQMQGRCHRHMQPAAKSGRSWGHACKSLRRVSG